jgi:putative ABC transport system substrate-binding protein
MRIKHLRRREFITLLSGAAIAWPLAARAQQPAMPVRRIGFLWSVGARTTAMRGWLDAFHQGLKEHGWFEGQNLSVEYRFAEGKMDLLPEIAAELVRLPLEVIVAEGTAAIQAAKNATQTVPIVMALSNDPVGSGFIASLNRPGGNITGLSLQTLDLGGKRLQLLTEIVPGLARVAVLSNPANPSSTVSLEQTQGAAQSLGIALHVVEMRAPDQFGSAFAAITAARPGGLIVLPDGMFFNEQTRIVGFASTSRLPALFPEKEVAEAGGLITYGPSIPATLRRAATYVDKILRGAKPADLPVEQPTKFELVINLKTAKALGLTVPLTLQASADQVIE